MLITAEDMWDAMTSCTRKKSSELDDLPFQFYLHIPYFFDDVLVGFYHNWHQNRRILCYISTLF